MKNNQTYRANIIGAGEVGHATTVELDANNIHQTNGLFWDTEGNEVIGTTALPHYGTFLTEEKCQLFGDVAGKKLLEIGCGRGHSLKYHADHQAAELWGIDIAKNQIEKSKEYLDSQGIQANLICAAMEEECGIPNAYFDFVYSVYGVGWATDLEGTFKRIASYLKKDGAFIFSWSHPIHKCVAFEDESLIIKKSYFDESWYSVSLGSSVLTLSDRKLSTYINACSKAGLFIEEVVEESDEEMIRLHEGSDFSKKASMIPVTFVIKARKIG